MNSPSHAVVRASIVVALVLTAGSWAMAQTAPDNTAVNKRDQQPAATTAGQQSNAKADLETTRQIRKALVADRNLSTYGRNIKIVTQGGKVTLKGPVQTDDEKKAIESKAETIAGAGNVMSEIAVKAVTTGRKSTTATKKKAGI